MSQYCYTPMDSPTFFGINGECGILLHDLDIEDGDLKAGDELISAIIIQLTTDMVYDKERGFFGDEFIGFPLGNQVWTLKGKPNRDNIQAKADQMIRQALEPIIDQGMIDDLVTRTVRVVGGYQSEIDIVKSGEVIARFTLT